MLNIEVPHSMGRRGAPGFQAAFPQGPHPIPIPEAGLQEPFLQDAHGPGPLYLPAANWPWE